MVSKYHFSICLCTFRHCVSYFKWINFVKTVMSYTEFHWLLLILCQLCLSSFTNEIARYKNSSSQGSGSHAAVQKRLSGLSMSLSGILPHTIGSSSASGSVPPSPLKPDFTSEPPFSAYRMQAVRKIDFQVSLKKLSTVCMYVPERLVTCSQCRSSFLAA